jgi:hypothetical protein
VSSSSPVGAGDASGFHVLAHGFTVNSDRLLKFFSDACQEVIKRTIVIIPYRGSTLLGTLLRRSSAKDISDNADAPTLNLSKSVVPSDICLWLHVRKVKQLHNPTLTSTEKECPGEALRYRQA